MKSPVIGSTTMNLAFFPVFALATLWSAASCVTHEHVQPHDQTLNFNVSGVFISQRLFIHECGYPGKLMAKCWCKGMSTPLNACHTLKLRVNGGI